MERRLLTFIVASTAFFFFYMTLRTMFGPPPQPPVAKNGADVVGEDEGPLAEDAAPVEDGEGTQLPAEGVAPGDAEDPSESEPEIKRPSKPSWMTLGSMDENSGHFMLVTLTTRGGGVERIELTERNGDGRFKYRRVDVRNGYLGYLAGTPAAQVDGVRVNVVGPGTPADRAGIKVGDIIVAVAGQVVISSDDIRRELQDTKPGDEVSVEVLRTSSNDAAESPEVFESQEDAGSVAPRGPPIVLTAKLTEHPLDVVRLAADGGADQIQGNLSRLSCLVTLGQINRKAIATGERAIKGVTDPAELIWSPETSSQDDQQTAEFSVTLGLSDVEAAGGKPIRFHRSYTLAPNSYALDMSVEIENLADEPQQLAYRLEGPNGITLEGWWYSNKISPHFSAAAARDIVYNNVADGHELISGYELLKRAKKETKAPDQNIFAPDGDSNTRELNYICVDAQYFTVGYLPPVAGAPLTTFRRASASVVADPSEVERHKERAVNCSFFLDSEVGEVPPGQSLRQDLQMFAGPKRPEVLAEYGLGDCVYYGWFAPFAKILASLLHVLWSVVGSYAVAIIILTVIVRGAMFPLSRKAAVNAQRMQELAPELKKIAEQYKDDMEGRLKAQRELQQRVGFNPLAGCLPMFLQLPIFIGLYRSLSVDIELRGEPFSTMTSWASNLAGPDMLAYWGDWLWEYLSGRGTGWLGPYFNILPVIVVVLFLAQQKMFMPPATDEQTAMTQKMMSIMTLMMGLFFFRVPAGLCIYFITSSLWGICERILVKKTLPSTPHFDTSVLEGSAKPTEKSVSLADRIRQQVTKPEEPVERPNKRRRPNGKKKK